MYDVSPKRLFFLGADVVTVLTASRALLRLLLEDRGAEVVSLPEGLGVLAVVLRLRLTRVVVASVVTRIVGAFRIKEGRVGFALIVCLGARRDCCLLFFEKRFVNRGSEKLLFRGPSGWDVVELTTPLPNSSDNSLPLSESGPSSLFLDSLPISPAIWLMTQETMRSSRRWVEWGRTRICWK